MTQQQQGSQIFSSPNVEIYYISPEHVIRPWKVATVRIMKLNDDSPAYIDVEQWIYPLIPQQTTIFRTVQGHYLFPDVNSPGW